MPRQVEQMSLRREGSQARQLFESLFVSRIACHRGIWPLELALCLGPGSKRMPDLLGRRRKWPGE